jgi:hypothetical protein
MSLAEELRKLRELHFSGALTDDEYSAAKAAVLDKYQGKEAPRSEVDPSMQAQLDDLRIQGEMAQLDRDWESERQQYMITGKHGNRHVPSQAGSLIIGLVVAGFGIFWTASAASMGAPGIFPCFGVFFILFGIGVSIYNYQKATRYNEALQRYEQRRATLRARYEGQRSQQADNHSS